MKRTLKSIMANPRASDREVGRSSGLSQPTVSRIRSELETAGVIESYEAIPNLQKLGFELIAVGVSNTDNPRELACDPRVILAYSAVSDDYSSSAEGWLYVSVHKSYSDFVDFKHRFLCEVTHLLLTSAHPLKAFSFKNISI